ncbi:hypothetical protein ACS0TY_021100 [Phlomoides rotata]
MSWEGCPSLALTPKAALSLLKATCPLHLSYFLRNNDFVSSLPSSSREKEKKWLPRNRAFQFQPTTISNNKQRSVSVVFPSGVTCRGLPSTLRKLH